MDGQEALELLKKNSYDVVVLDVNMPRMNGLQLLYELQKAKISVRIMMASTDTRDGARTTLDDDLIISRFHQGFIHVVSTRLCHWSRLRRRSY